MRLGVSGKSASGEWSRLCDGVHACVGRNGQQGGGADDTGSRRSYHHKCCTACRGCRRGPTWLCCALVRIGARLGFRAPAKVRCGCSGVARLRGICSAVIGSAAQRSAGTCVQRLSTGACPRGHAHESRKGTYTTCRARRCVAVRRWGTFGTHMGCSEYSHGVLLSSHSGTLRIGQGYCEYSHL